MPKKCKKIAMGIISFDLIIVIAVWLKNAESCYFFFILALQLLTLCTFLILIKTGGMSDCQKKLNCVYYQLENIL